MVPLSVALHCNEDHGLFLGCLQLNDRMKMYKEITCHRL